MSENLGTGARGRLGSEAGAPDLAVISLGHMAGRWTCRMLVDELTAQHTAGARPVYQEFTNTQRAQRQAPALAAKGPPGAHTPSDALEGISPPSSLLQRSPLVWALCSLQAWRNCVPFEMISIPRYQRKAHLKGCHQKQHPVTYKWLLLVWARNGTRFHTYAVRLGRRDWRQRLPLPPIPSK